MTKKAGLKNIYSCVTSFADDPKHKKQFAILNTEEYISMWKGFLKLIRFTEVVFLVMLGTSSIPVRHEV